MPQKGVNSMRSYMQFKPNYQLFQNTTGFHHDGVNLNSFLGGIVLREYLQKIEIFFFYLTKVLGIFVIHRF